MVQTKYCIYCRYLYSTQLWLLRTNEGHHTSTSWQYAHDNVNIYKHTWKVNSLRPSDPRKTQRTRPSLVQIMGRPLFGAILLTQCRVIVRSPGNIFHWLLNRNASTFIQKSNHMNFEWNMAAIVSRLQNDNIDYYVGCASTSQALFQSLWIFLGTVDTTVRMREHRYSYHSSNRRPLGILTLQITDRIIRNDVFVICRKIDHCIYDAPRAGLHTMYKNIWRVQTELSYDIV